MKRNKLWLGVLSCIAITMMFSSQVNGQIFFGFDNADFDNGATIGATTTAGGVTASLVDVFAPEFEGLDTTGDGLPDTFNLTGNILRASLGDAVGLQVQSDDLGVDNPTVEDIDFGSGIENRDINPGEGFVIEFDQDVIFTEIDFASLDGDGGFATATIEGMGSFDIVFDAANGTDVFSLPFGANLIPAGADIEFTFTSPSDAFANLRIDDFLVVTSADALAQPTFDFNNNTDLDNGQGVGATTTATSLDGSTAVTLSIVDVFAPEFVNNAPTANILSALQGDLVVTQIGSNSLGVDNPSVTDDDFFAGAGIENRDFNPGEGLVFEFDVPVIITDLNLVSLDDGTVTVDIEGVGSFTLVSDDVNNPMDDFSLPFGNDFIPAGADITFSLSSPAVPDASVRIAAISVSTDPVEDDALKGDADLDGDVDFADIPAFIDVLLSGVFQAESDCDCSGMVDFADIPVFIDILLSQ